MIMFLKPFKFWKMLPSCSVRNIIFWLCLIHLKKLYIDLILSILGLFLWSVKHISLYSSVYKILFFIVTIHLFYSLVSFILVCHRVCLEEFESWKAFKCLQERSVLTCKQMDNRYPHSRNSQFLCRPIELILFPLVLYLSPDRFWYPYIYSFDNFFFGLIMGIFKFQIDFHPSKFQLRQK